MRSFLFLLLPVTFLGCNKKSDDTSTKNLKVEGTIWNENGPFDLNNNKGESVLGVIVSRPASKPDTFCLHVAYDKRYDRVKEYTFEKLSEFPVDRVEFKKAITEEVKNQRLSDLKAAGRKGLDVLMFTTAVPIGFMFFGVGAVVPLIFGLEATEVTFNRLGDALKRVSPDLSEGVLDPNSTIDTDDAKLFKAVVAAGKSALGDKTQNQCVDLVDGPKP